MSNKVNVSTTTNKVTITPQQNASVSIGSTSTPLTVTQGSTSVVQVVSQGPQGTTGTQGIPGSLEASSSLNITGSITTSGDISASGTIYGDVLDGGANLTLTSEGFTKLEGGGNSGGIILSDGTISRLVFDVGGTPGVVIAGNFFIDPTGGNVIFSGSNIEVQGNVSASGNVYGDKIYVLNTGEGSGLEFTGANNRIYYDNPNITTQIDDSDILQVKPTGIQVSGQISTLNYQNNGTVADTNLTGSFTGSFVGNGSGLTDLPQNRSFGLSITSSGDISASGGIYGDVYYSDNIRVLASTTTGGSYLGSVTNKTEIDGTAITLDAHVTASGNISASGTITGDGYPFHQSPFLFTLQTSSTTGTTIFSESIAGFTPTGTIGGSTIGVIYFSSQSANGIRMTGNNPVTIPSTTTNYFNDVGSQITLTSTSSGKFIRVKTTGIVSNANQFQFTYQDALVITGSTGFPDSGDVVEMSWDNSAGVGTIQATGINNFDTTINKIEIAYRTSSAIYAPNIAAQFGDESPVSLASLIYTIPFISKSADLTLNSLTTVGNISSSAGTGSFGRMILPNLPTTDPEVAGMLFTTQSAGTGGNLDGQKILLVSEG